MPNQHWRKISWQAEEARAWHGTYASSPLCVALMIIEISSSGIDGMNDSRCSARGRVNSAPNHEPGTAVATDAACVRT